MNPHTRPTATLVAVGLLALTGCTDQSPRPVADTQEGVIPDGWDTWFELGAMECDAISAPVLAAQIKHQGDFRTHPPRDLGHGLVVGGIPQFTEDLWNQWGYDVDDQGRQTGEPGAGDWNDPADAIMAQARFNCDNAEMIQGWMDEGKVQGDLTALTLGASLTGADAIRNQGGFDTAKPAASGSRPADYAHTVLTIADDITASDTFND